MTRQETLKAEEKLKTLEQSIAKSRRVRIDWKTGLEKPVLRGWIHTVCTPLSLIASIVLVVLSPAQYRLACIVYLFASLVLFSISALYHMGAWSRSVDAVFKRLDHANIFLLIAGTYTPVSVALLDKNAEFQILLIVWLGALAGIVGHVAWISAPRWIYTPLYVLLGWVAIFYMPALWQAGGPALVWLLIAGGLSYTLGAVVYGFKWPDPFPQIFGFHEIFHAATVGGWTCHCVAAYLAVLG